ncbi:MAG: hypothetical protein ABIW84_05995 [Ilumatobacteraceae bacterium]
MTKSTRRTWRLPVGLLALSFIPIAVGTFRLSQLASGATVTTENTRFFSSPVPVVVHIVSVTVFVSASPPSAPVTSPITAPG